jgi:hypothetical protein
MNKTKFFLQYKRETGNSINQYTIDDIPKDDGEIDADEMQDQLSSINSFINFLCEKLER